MMYNVDGFYKNFYSTYHESREKMLKMKYKKITNDDEKKTFCITNLYNPNKSDSRMCFLLLSYCITVMDLLLNVNYFIKRFHLYKLKDTFATKTPSLLRAGKTLSIYYINFPLSLSVFVAIVNNNNRAS